MKKYRKIFSGVIVVVLLGGVLLIGTGKANAESIVLPIILYNYSDPKHPTPTPIVTITPGPDPVPADIACLFVIGDEVGPPFPSLYGGCAPTKGGPRETSWEYDSAGQVISITYRIWDPTKTYSLYEADMDIEHYPSGLLKSYSGPVFGDGINSFHQIAVNRYNPSGGILGADVTKTYDSSGDVYLLDLHEYCPNSLDVYGYEVSLDAMNYAVGACQ